MGELPDIDERARVNAAGEVERRSILTSIVIVIIAVLFAFSPESPTNPPVFQIALAVVAPVASVRMLLFAYALRLPLGSARRLRFMFRPLLAQVAAWGAFAAWGAVAAEGTGLG